MKTGRGVVEKVVNGDLLGYLVTIPSDGMYFLRNGDITDKDVGKKVLVDYEPGHFLCTFVSRTEG
jgi:hypothetical protein